MIIRVFCILQCSTKIKKITVFLICIPLLVREKLSLFFSYLKYHYLIFCFLVRHCHLFPRALGEIVGHYNVQELHISFTEGLWRHESWGYPVHDAAPGAELWAWFKEGTKK